MRLAEAVHEAGDTELLVRVVELLEATIKPTREPCAIEREASGAKQATDLSSRRLPCQPLWFTISDE